MKESLWGYLIFVFGVIVISVILLVSRVTTHAEEDYYLARETMQAALLDSIDYAAYRTTGRIIISKSKFIEIYVRRFSESVTNSQNYKLDFYDIYEEPPKASVRIRTMSGKTAVQNDELSFSVDTLITGILETNFEQYNATKDSDGNYSEGKSITIRYKGNESKSESVTLILPGTSYSNVSAENSAACSGGACNAFINGKQEKISLSLLSERNPRYKKLIKNFEEVKYKYCEYPELKKDETSESTTMVTKYVKIDGVKIYSDPDLKNGTSIARCTKLSVSDNCRYGSNASMCKTSDGRYIAKSDLTSEVCNISSIPSEKTSVNPQELENLKDAEKIKEELQKNKAILIILDASGVNDLGDPETGFYYRQSDGRMYRYYNVDTKTYTYPIEVIKLPTKTISSKEKKTCVYEYNGKTVIGTDGKFVVSNIDTSKSQITLKANCD